MIDPEMKVFIEALHLSLQQNIILDMIMIIDIKRGN